MDELLFFLCGGGTDFGGADIDHDRVDEGARRADVPEDEVEDYILRVLTEAVEEAVRMRVAARAEEKAPKAKRYRFMVAPTPFPVYVDAVTDEEAEQKLDEGLPDLVSAALVDAIADKRVDFTIVAAPEGTVSHIKSFPAEPSPSH